jgi:hypothetical protein
VGLSAPARAARPPTRQAPRSGAVTVSCGMCSGTGRVVHGRATDFYREVGTSWRSTAELAAAVGVSATHAANVLELLHSLGLVARVGTGRNGSPYRWRRA